MFNIAIIGATGYVGAEIIRILSQHPEVKVSAVFSRSYAQKAYSDIYPGMEKVFTGNLFSMDTDALCGDADIFITALPHDASNEIIPFLVEKGKRVIDHSAAFRFKNKNTYEAWYKTTHCMDSLLELAVYGLPELYRNKISKAQLVANPGCYPTCAVLGTAPLIANKIVNFDNIIIDAASGVSGAGRKSDLAYSFCETHENYKAYGVASHRHTPEIEQELSNLAGKEVLISFTPHLIPIKRGLMCTSYLNLKESSWTSEMLYDMYCEYYKNEFFVRVLKPHILPEIKNVAGSNFIDISVNVDKRLNRAVVISAIDNLGKGAAGQAVQCLNLMLGIDEAVGLKHPGMFI
jgi:N-acetyl-gamma-glutamyl-phosphate reductase